MQTNEDAVGSNPTIAEDTASDSQNETNHSESHDATQENNDTSTVNAPVNSGSAEQESGSEDTRPSQERIRDLSSKVKEKAEEAEKYRTGHDNWSAMAQLMQSDPEFGAQAIERLEKLGRVPAGTTDKFKAQFGKTTKKDSTEGSESKQEDTNVSEDAVKKVLESDPVYQQSRALVEQQRQEREQWLNKFEEERPDIAKSANPGLVRSQIANTAAFYEQAHGLSYEQAMDRAYKSLLHPDKIAEEAREDGKVEGLVQGMQESAVTLASGGGTNRPRVKLTAEQEEARKVLGMSPERYAEFTSNEPTVVD